jgi:hypothetical protein
MTASNSLLKAKPHNELSKLIEADVLIGGTGQDTCEHPIGARHPFSYLDQPKTDATDWMAQIVPSLG